MKEFLSKTYLKDVISHELKIFFKKDEYCVVVKKILNIKEPFILNEMGHNIKLLDNNYFIIEYMPCEKNYFCRAFIDSNNEVREYFYQFTKEQGIENCIPYYVKYNVAYEKYSYQLGKKENRYTYQKSLELLKKLVAKRKEYNREGELMIGARTCMRPENAGSYLTAAKELVKIGVDSFQVVKILIPIGDDITKYKLSDKTIEELTFLRENYESMGLMHVQIPGSLDYTYYDRKIEDSQKPSQCYSSLVSPILYGPNLIICTHWEKIKDIDNSHYGSIKGNENELEKIMMGKRAEKIREQVPKRCSSCCAIYDNQMLEMIRAQLSLVNNINDVDFYLTY